MYNVMATSRHRFYSDDMKARIGTHLAYEDLSIPVDRMRRWHPLNRSLYLGYKTLLCGMLLNHKGDRVAMANSVETRYPFLDDNVIALSAKVHPKWKLRRARYDKYLLRMTAARYLPKEVALRPKGMFRAPFADSFFANAPPYVRQLMSEESLRKTGYFDVAKVRKQYELYTSHNASKARLFMEMGMVSVVSTQLWHHLYLGGGLCELPDTQPRPVVERPAA
jgi:asparagine synthase (glutamine-hydrolysing)